MLTNQPEKIDKYSIESILGQGAMGVVYKAYDQAIDRHVAIKVVHPHLLSGEMSSELEQRFKHEVKAAAKCLHPNIVTIFDYGICNGSPYMVMEYVQGIDLGVILKAQKPFSFEQAINISCHVLDALYAAHQMGIVHRDIKPANILLLENGVVKVTDFGVARIDNSELTQVGDVIGTPSFMSPEAKAGLQVDSRSDLYSAALVIFELLTLKRIKPTQIKTKIIPEAIAQLKLSKAQRKKLQKFFIKALENKPEKRYQSALLQSKALADILGVHLDHYQQSSSLGETVTQLRSKVEPPPIINNSEQSPSSTSLSHLNSTDLSIVEKKLTKYIGPVAAILLKRQATKNTTIEQLLNSLSSYIPSAKERDEFILSMESSNILNTTYSLAERKARATNTLSRLISKHSKTNTILIKN